MILLKMVTDSTIACDICLGRTKIGSMINFGLRPYYKDKVIKTLVPEKGCMSKICFVFW